MNNKILSGVFFLIILIRTAFPYSAYYSEKLTNYHSFRYIYSMSQSQDKTYFATENGIIVYSHVFKEWEKPMNQPIGLPGLDIRTVYYHKETGYLWAAVEDKLYILYSESAFRWEKVDVFYKFIRIGSSGERLFADVGKGYVELDPYNGTIIQNNVNINFPVDWSVSGIEMDLYKVQFTGEYIIDTEGSIVQNAFVKYPIAFSVFGIYQNLWMGTLGNGLYGGDRFMMLVEHVPYGLINNNVTKIMVRDGLVLIGHGPDMGGHDDRNGWSESDTSFQYFHWFDDYMLPTLSNQSVRGFVKNNDTLLVITDNSIIFNDSSGDDIHTITPGVGLINSVTEVMQDEKYGWILASTGLFMIDLKDLYIKPIPDIPGNSLTGYRNNDNLYLGGYFGIQVYSVTDSLLLRPVYEYTRHNFAVRNITGNGKKLFWSDEHAVLSSDPRITNVKRIHLPGINTNDRINDLVCNDTWLWIGTNQGLYSYNLNTEQIVRITQEEGLCSNRIQTMELSGNILYIGTDKGMSLYEFEN